MENKPFRIVYDALPEGWREYGERLADDTVLVVATDDRYGYKVLRHESWDVNQGLAEPELGGEAPCER